MCYLFRPPLPQLPVAPPPPPPYSKATPVSKHTQLVHKLRLMLSETQDQPSQYILDICQWVDGRLTAQLLLGVIASLSPLPLLQRLPAEPSAVHQGEAEGAQ